MARPRLTEQFTAGLSRPVLLVSAPPGFGKTTLLSDWRAQAGQHFPIGWLTLDDDDNDLAGFFRYVIAALQTIQPDAGQAALAMLEASRALAIKSAVAALLEDWAAVEQPFALVLDDYHVIREPAIHEALIFLAEHLPDPFHLVVITRSDPPWPLARWRVRDQLAEIRAEALRFTQAEAAAFLGEVMGLALTAEQVAAIEGRTEGWIAALQLAALAWRAGTGTPPTPGGVVETFLGSPRFVLDYLVSEVLERQPGELQTFLLETSILERLSADVCGAVWSGSSSLDGEHDGPLTSRPQSQAILEHLDRTNLFVTPLDETREWYRYHPLFADVLRHLLRRQWPERVPVLHQRASRWFAQHGRIEAAVLHALAAGDQAGAASVVEAAGRQPGNYPDVHTLRGWMRRLPEPLVRSRPRLALLQAQVCLFEGELGAVAERVRDMEQQLATAAGPEADDRWLQAELAVLRGLLSILTSHAEDGLAQSEGALRQLPADHPLRVVALLNIGLAHYLQLELDQAAQSFAETRRAALALGDPYRAEVATAYLGQTRALQGRRNEAEQLYREGLSLCPERARAPSLNGLYAGLSALLYERNDLAAAEAAARRGLALAEDEGNKLVLIGARLSLANIRLAQGDPAAGRALLAEAVRLAEQEHIGWLWMSPSVAAAQAHWWLRAGDLAAAVNWARTSQSAPTGSVLEHGAAALARARVSVAEGDAASALAQLRPLQTAAEAAGCRRAWLEALLLRALALHAQGQLATALAALEPALACAEPEGYVRLWLDEGPAMQKLLAEWQARRGARAAAAVAAYVGRLLEAFPQPQSAQSAANEQLPEPLTERELEILRLMAQGLSNPEIARQLVLSVTTVKKHGTNLFGKLGVTGRAEAIAQARDLGLLA